MEKLREKLENETCPLPEGSTHTPESVGLSQEDLLLALDAGFCNFALHCESRIASMLGAQLMCRGVLAVP